MSLPILLGRPFRHDRARTYPLSPAFLSAAGTMNEQDLKAIEQFLATRETADLFEYFNVARTVDPTEAEAVVRARRSWAQGQQANPKFRQEAIWIIKNVALCKRAIGDEKDDYLRYLNEKAQAEALATLSTYLDGAVFDGQLTLEREEGAVAKGIGLKLSDDVIEEFIERYLVEHEVYRVDSGPLVNYYTEIGVPKDSPADTLAPMLERLLVEAKALGPRGASRRRTIRMARRVLLDRERRREYDNALEVESPPDSGLPVFGSPNEHEPQLEPQYTKALNIRTAEGTQDSDSLGASTLSLRDPPPPPDHISKTLPYKSGENAVRSPRAPIQLVIDGERERSVRVGRGPATVELVVRNEGDGRMHGKVVVDRPWMSVIPDRLDPDRTEQTITVTIDPTQLTRSRAVAMVTIIPERGGSRYVTITAERDRKSLVWVGGVFALMAAGGFIAAWPTLSASLFPPEPPPPPAGTLSVRVDPHAGEVHVNGKLINSGGEALNVQNLPLKTPINVRVVLDGFQTWEQDIVLANTEPVTVRPELILADLMDFEPTAEHLQGSMDRAEVSRAIRGLQERVRGCVETHTPGEPRAEKRMDLMVFVRSSGHVGSTQFEGDIVPPPGAKHCIDRQLRALRVPLFEGDYDIARESFTVSLPTGETPSP